MQFNSSKSILLIPVLTASALFGLPILGDAINQLRTSARTEDTPSSLLSSLIGVRILLPSVDAFGNHIESGRRNIAVLPGCNSCSLTSSGEVKIPSLSEADILLTPDKSDTTTLELASNTSTRRYNIVIDSSHNVLSARLYEIAPFFIELDSSNVVTDARKAQ